MEGMFDENQQAPSVIFASGLYLIGDLLRRQFNATDDEINYINQLLCLRMKERTNLPHNHGIPSVVIDDFLYHGDLWHASNFNLLNQLGIRHIVNVCDIQLESQISSNFNVLWINLPDELQSNIKANFDKTNQFLYECKTKNEKVLVNCQMGISRSSTIVLAYLMKYHHDSLLKAYDYLLERRRIAAPNHSFLLQLVRYEKELRATKEIDETQNNDDKENPIEIAKLN